MAMNLCLVLGVLGFTAMSGARLVMSLYAIELGAQPFLVGVLVATMQAMPLFLSLPCGRLCDRNGTRGLLMVGFSCLIVAMMLIMLWPALAMLFVVAILNGLLLAIHNVAVQHVAGALSAPARRARNFSNLALTGATSNLLGPVIGGVSVDLLGFTGACGAMLGIATLGVGAIGRWGHLLPRGNPSARLASQAVAGAAAAREAPRRPPLRDVWRLLIVSALTQLCMDSFLFCLPVYARSIDLSASTIGFVVGAFAVAIFLFRALMPTLLGWLGELRLLAASFAISGLGFAAMPMFQSAWLLALTSFVIGLGCAVGQPLTMMMVVARSREGHSGEMLGLQLTVNGAGRSVGPLLMGAAGSLAGIGPVFVLCALFMGLGGWLTGAIPPAEVAGRSTRG